LIPNSSFETARLPDLFDSLPDLLRFDSARRQLLNSHLPPSTCANLYLSLVSFQNHHVLSSGKSFVARAHVMKSCSHQLRIIPPGPPRVGGLHLFGLPF
jgi:hypothetical protein